MPSTLRNKILPQITFFSCQILPDCQALEPDWKKVVTEPSLPVQEGAVIQFKCSMYSVNIGGREARCNDGQIVPKQEPPLCKTISRFSQFYKNGA